MCRVRVREDVESKADLQNLITSVILRQRSPFSIQDILDNTKNQLIGSHFEDSDDITKQMIEDTITELNLIDCVRSIGNKKYKLTMSFPAIVSTQ